MKPQPKKIPACWVAHNSWNKMNQGNCFTRHQKSNDNKASLTKSRLLTFLSFLLTRDCWQRPRFGKVTQRPISWYSKLFCCSWRNLGVTVFNRHVCTQLSTSFTSVLMCVQHNLRWLMFLLILFVECAIYWPMYVLSSPIMLLLLLILLICQNSAMHFCNSGIFNNKRNYNIYTQKD